MRFGVLGPVAVWTAAGHPLAVPEGKVRTLLADLLVHAGRPVDVARLVEHLWGAHPPGDPTNTLQTKVSQLRRTLERAQPGTRQLVVRQPPGYLLRVEPGTLDAHRFRELTGRARATADPGARAALLTDALTLWRGPALADVRDEPFAMATARRLEDERLAAEEDRAAARLALDRIDIDAAPLGPLVAELGDLVDRHPLRERLRGLHMRALYRAGRQGEALAGFAQLRARSIAELGLEPGPELTALQQAVLAQDPALLDAPPPNPTPVSAGPNAPPPARPQHAITAPLTALIGRDREVAEVRARLDPARLVTLTGPGGVGKTRLAVEVARAVATPDSGPDKPGAGHHRSGGADSGGVCLVELAGLDRRDSPDGSDAGPPTDGRVAAAVAAALGVRDAGDGPPAALADRVGEAVADNALLLVLDNCEQVVEEVAAFATRLLRVAPRLRILATSREPLGVTGEVLVEVEPLELPAAETSPTGTDLAAVRDAPAVRLFTERATAAAPGFRLDAQTAPVVATLCRRLDGLPLALELAAARVRALGVSELLARLDDRFTLLTRGPRDAPDRQRTLRAVIDWSWQLLTPAERVVLRRLAVHPGGCDLDAAAVVCAGDGVAPEHVLDLLARLVDRSLVVSRPDADGRPRFRLLETIAAYGRERMAEADELEQVRHRHGQHYLALAEEAEPELRGPRQQSWLQRLDAESANLRAALDHLVQQADGAHPALRLARSLCWYWFLRGRTGEADRALRAALAVPGSAPTDLRAQVAAGLTALRVLDGERPDDAALDAPTLDVPDPVARARTQWFLGYALTTVADRRAEPLTAAALAGFEALGDRWGRAAALADRSAQVTARGDLNAARAHAEDAAALFDAVGDRWGQVQATFALGALAEIAGDHRTAAAQHRAGLRMAEELGLWAEVSYQLSWLGRIALLEHRYAEAAALHRRAVDIAVARGFAPARIYALTGLAMGARRTGDLDAAEEHLRTILDWHRGSATEDATTLIRAELGFVAELRGDATAATRLQRAGYAVARRTGDPRARALALEGVAGAAAAAGNPTLAARLLGAAAAARNGVGAPLPPAERGDVDRITAAATAALDAAAFADEFARGAVTDPDELVDAAPVGGAPVPEHRTARTGPRPG